jgi:hypothetical protein
MGIKLSNNAFGTLAASINSSATSITLTTGQGARFPTLAGGDYFYATLVDTSNNLEIVKCTARSTDVLTVVRAQESTTARAYNTGDRIEIRITAATFVDATSVYDILTSSTGYFDLPSGTTAQRPGSPVEGMIRHNASLDTLEFYDTGIWKQVNTSYNIDYLVVAGGGGGGCYGGGGGGAGGYRTATIGVNPATAYAVSIGAGGAGTAIIEGQGASGSNSSLIGGEISVTSSGGGGGGSGSNVSGFSAAAGVAGGSGGGGGGRTGRPGGAGTSGQGFAGGASMPSDTSGVYGAGGGGGASAVGANGLDSGATGGAGGAGLNWQSLGTTYAGGGGGGTFGGTPGSGGAGGGGNGGAAATGGNVGGNGTANTGGGSGGGTGGATASGASSAGGTGGSGIVIIRYLGTQKGTGGTVTSAGGYTYHTFTSSGTFTA